MLNYQRVLGLEILEIASCDSEFDKARDLTTIPF